MSIVISVMCFAVCCYVFYRLAAAPAVSFRLRDAGLAVGAGLGAFLNLLYILWRTLP